MYLAKSYWFIRALFPDYFIWNMPRHEKVIYLTFDDGPHPVVTPFVLDLLKKYNAKATFFCIGNNVVNNRNIYEQVLAEGHNIGNHTQQHLNGWKTQTHQYLQDIDTAATAISSNLFRPPYGKIKHKQAKLLHNNKVPFKIVMWDVLSRDFDTSLTAEDCYKTVIKHTQNGSIIVFHDSEKAFDRLQYCLPKVLAYFSKQGFVFEKLAL